MIRCRTPVVIYLQVFFCSVRCFTVLSTLTMALRLANITRHLVKFQLKTCTEKYMSVSSMNLTQWTYYQLPVQETGLNQDPRKPHSCAHPLTQEQPLSQLQYHGLVLPVFKTYINGIVLCIWCLLLNIKST